MYLCQECTVLIFTCAINWMILTKILRGMSLGTTLRDPLGKSVVIMVLRRLWTNKKIQMGHVKIFLCFKTIHSDTEENVMLKLLFWMRNHLQTEDKLLMKQWVLLVHMKPILFLRHKHVSSLSVELMRKSIFRRGTGSGYLPLCCGVALTLYPDHVDPQQSIQRLQCNTSHFRIPTLS